MRGLPDDGERRLETVESRLALAEDLLETLNHTVYRQQEHIARLERELRQMREQLEGISLSLDSGAPRQELPPHY